jgi:hypothetical protein
LTTSTDASVTSSKESGSSPRQSTDSSALYKGWMTGYGYQAILSIFFDENGKRKQAPINGNKKSDYLLEWLYTYRDLVDEWSQNKKPGDNPNIVGSMISFLKGETKESNEFENWDKFIELYTQGEGSSEG